MILIIAKSDDGQLLKKLSRSIPSLELAEGVYLTWAPKEKVAKTVDQLKGLAIKTWEERGRGPLFEAAVLELTEDQFRQLRNMAKTVIEKAAEAMSEEVDRLIKRLRSAGGEGAAGWYRDLARRYQKLLDACISLGVEPTAVGRLKEKWKEATIEAGRALKKGG